MARGFTAASFFGRWLFAIILVFGTYNPSGYSYISWLMGAGTELVPVHAIVGLVLLIGWIVFLRATFLALGLIGITLGAALFASIVWFFVDMGLISIDATGVLAYVSLLILSFILATGMSWSHIRRRLTGQFDVDDIED